MVCAERGCLKRKRVSEKAWLTGGTYTYSYTYINTEPPSVEDMVANLSARVEALERNMMRLLKGPS